MSAPYSSGISGDDTALPAKVGALRGETLPLTDKRCRLKVDARPVEKGVRHD
jgi:hypothetical protein